MVDSGIEVGGNVHGNHANANRYLKFICRYVYQHGLTPKPGSCIKSAHYFLTQADC